MTFPISSRPKAIVPNAIRAIYRRFITECRTLPVEAWQAWAKSLIAGLGVCAVFAYILTQSAMSFETAGLQAWDEQWLLKMRSYSPLSFSKAVTWESPGNLVGVLPIFFTVTALTAWFRKPLVTATVIANYLGQFALVWICWGSWSRDRPTLIAQGMAAPGLHSFPSGHVVVATTFYGLLFYLWYRTSRSWLERVVTLAFATVWIGLIALSRLALGAHWPSDVLAGLAVGGLWLVTVIVALERGRRATCSPSDKPSV